MKTDVACPDCGSQLDKKSTGLHGWAYECEHCGYLNEVNTGSEPGEK